MIIRKRAVLKIDKSAISVIPRELYSSFIEHIGRTVYGGIYEKGHPLADGDGFREDVAELIRELGVELVRYPGGNFVSGYDWKDGIGKNRPKKLDLAWGQLEPNIIGTDEFMKYSKKVGFDVMMSVNLGTGTPKSAAELVEYCNCDADSYYAGLRRENGHKEPYGIKYWCLGNEMDGDWQICSLTASEYGRKAHEAAKMMKWVDGNISLIACGSSVHNMPTYPEWDKTILQYLYNDVDYLSMHQYYPHPKNGNLKDFLGCFTDFDSFIADNIAVCDYVKAEKRSNKTMMLSFDEWNIWDNDPTECNVERWTVGPKRCENIYRMVDALAVGNLLCVLVNRSNRVKIACLAQLVNVIAPIITQNGGKAIRQATYYPFKYFSSFGKGKALVSEVECESIESGLYGEYPMINCACSFDEESGKGAIFAVNNSLDEDVLFGIKSDKNIFVEKIITVESDSVEDANSFEEEKIRTIERIILPGDEIVLNKSTFNVLVYALK